MRVVLASFALALVAAGCSGSETTQFVAISPARPPAPARWPKYPTFSQHSCWARPTTSPSITQVAPSFPVDNEKPMAPHAIVRRLLARFGDRSYIRGIDIGKPPPRRVTRHVFPGKGPPRDAVWAYIDAPLASIDWSAHSTAARVRAYALARWETGLVGGALRDEFCRAGGPTLAGWTISGKGIDGGASDGTFALNQHFPNLSPAEFRARAAQAGKKFGFRVQSIRFLRPRELAPIVLVSTTRDRKEFIQDVPAIVAVLDPQAVSGRRMAVTFEGLFFEARDANGPFVRVDNSYRGEVMGGQWSAEPGAYPYEHG